MPKIFDPSIRLVAGLATCESKSHTSANSDDRTPRPPGDASLTQKLFKYEPPSLMAARTTRLTGDGMVLELEELLELDRLLLELDDDGGTRDELLLKEGELELLETLLVDEELLLD